MAITCDLKLHITPVLRNAGSSDQLTWNFPMKFTIDEAEGLEDRLNLVIKIMAVNWLIRKTWGKVRVPIKDLMKDIKDEGKESQLVTYPVVNRKGASLTFSYEFGKKFLHEVKAPYTKPGSKLERSSSRFGEFLTGVVDVADVAYVVGCGCGGDGCDGGGCGGGGCGD
ncbi:C2 domain-containing protein [Artemisia annua]|uniref:C2 domain-containing protein n=1 Tax=Artemisia annua TaxID=35608 RepID=A0A2U1QL52_ARTAN|nr:C2 domain-containing protein [Artemisia annua]